jgi:hypothetical protein
MGRKAVGTEEFFEMDAMGAQNTGTKRGVMGKVTRLLAIPAVVGR